MTFRQVKCPLNELGLIKIITSCALLDYLSISCKHSISSAETGASTHGQTYQITYRVILIMFAQRYIQWYYSQVDVHRIHLLALALQ